MTWMLGADRPRLLDASTWAAAPDDEVQIDVHPGAGCSFSMSWVLGSASPPYRVAYRWTGDMVQGASAEERAALAPPL